MILPHREVEFADGDYGVFAQTGPDGFEWIKVKSKADGEQLIAMVEALAAEIRSGALPPDPDREGLDALIEKYRTQEPGQ